MKLRTLLVLLAAALLPALAHAQPFGAWLNVSGPTHGYLQVPSSPALNPASAITIEAWVSVTDPGGCSSIVGKNFLQAWWVGICGTTLRSYIRGYDPTGTAVPIKARRDAGTIPAGWTHVAVTFDGTTRRHYINGELVGSWVEPGPLSATADALRIGSDVQWLHTPSGSIDEVRLWNVARTVDQLREKINVTISPQPGLVAYWRLDGGGTDASGHGHTGALLGAGAFFWTFPAVISCGASTSTTLCVQDVLSISAKFRLGGPGTAETQAHVGPSNSSSGIFWFFASNNWEVTVKTVDGCGVNPYYWVFLTSDTSLFYRVEVFDVLAGEQKIYFNYATVKPFSILDTKAFGKSCL